MSNPRVRATIKAGQEGSWPFIAISIILALTLAFIVLLSVNFYRIQRINTKVHGMKKEVATPFIIDEVEQCERSVFLGGLWCRTYFYLGTSVFGSLTF